jgi:hypothetical protein
MMDCDGRDTTAGASSSSLPTDKHTDVDSLYDVHKSVVDAFAPSALSPGQASSSASASPSFAQFLHTLTKSGSGKTFMIQKKYRKELGPILEATDEGEVSEEKVYESTNSEGAATSEQCINPGQGVLALAAPCLQHERTDVVIHVDGSQPEADCTQEEPLSQVDNPVDMESTETRINDCLPQAGGGQQTIRMSSRIIS